MKKTSAINNKSSKKDPATGADQQTARHSHSRRRLLQSLAAGGAAVTVKALPEKWTRPVLDTTLVPAHAQTTCEVQSLTCRVDSVNFGWSGTQPNPFVPPLPLVGNTNTGYTIDDFYAGPNSCANTADGVATSATLSVTASVDPACGPVDLTSGFQPLIDEFVLNSPSMQSGVVNQNGSVGFNNVVVGIALPPAPTASDVPQTVSSELSLTFAAPGQQCVININFTEQTVFSLTPCN